jgi:choline kinase
MVSFNITSEHNIKGVKVILLPVAGQSARFKEVGIDPPKWSLQVGNQSIINRAINSVLDSRNVNEQLVVTCLKEHLEFFTQAINKELYEKITFVTLDHQTNGQAETILRTLEKIQVNNHERLIIWCGDSAFRPESFNFSSKKGNWILVSNLPGDHWSFVKQENGKVIEVTEKSRISNHASLGLYSFDTIQSFIDTKPLDLRWGYKESFVAPLYNTLISKEEKIEMFSIDPQDYFPMGTPKEIVKTAKRMNWDLPNELIYFSP